MTGPSRRLLILLLPLLAVGSVGWAFVTTLRPARVLAARVHGGPCAAGTPRSLLVALSWALGDERKAASHTALRVSLSEASGTTQRWQGATDAEGLVEIVLGPCTGATPTLTIESGSGARLAHGELAPSSERWRAAERRGGWLTAQTSGEVVLAVAPLEGALAVPFTSRLLLAAQHQDGSAAPGVQLRLESDGAALGPVAVTDVQGHARVAIEPQEHAISLRVEARAETGAVGQWYGALPVVPGALHAALDGPRLLVRSPIARERAYVSLIDEGSRLAGFIVGLAPDASGGAAGSVALTSLPGAEQAPLWAVLSSEADKHSAGVVGWPLRHAGFPPRTFDALDQPLLDGLPDAVASERAARQTRRRTASLGATLAGLLTAALFAFEVRSAERRALALGAVATRRSGAWLALACLALGLAALVWFGTRGAP